MAQPVPKLDPGGRSEELLPEMLREKDVALEPPAAVAPPEVPPPPSGKTFFQGVYAGRIELRGSTALTAEEIRSVVAPYEGRKVTMEDLERVRRALTLLYVRKGYINSGIVIPDQTVEDDVIILQAIEGRLARIDVFGNKWFRDSYLRDRVMLGAGTPLNVQPLQARLQQLQQDPRIQRIQAELKPGMTPGESVLQLKVEEKAVFSAGLTVNNYQSPSVGAERWLLSLSHMNLTGRGDYLFFNYGGSRGVDLMLDTSYMAPLNVHGTTAALRYRKNSFGVVDRSFAALNIVSKSESVETSVRHPVYWSPEQEVALGLSLERSSNRSYLLGEPFSFSLGADNGKSVVIPLRFSQEWTYRTQREVYSARSRFTFGLGIGDATVSSDKRTPDGKYLAWLGQFQLARIIDPGDTQLLVRADLQRADQPLLPAEQVGLGGRYSVRGYRENLVVRDEAFIASVEWRVPLVQNRRWAEYLQACPFFDYGSATNRYNQTPDPKELASAGIGLRWGASWQTPPVSLRPEMELYWGYRLKEVAHPNDNLQDHGIHFQFSVSGTF